MFQHSLVSAFKQVQYLVIGTKYCGCFIIHRYCYNIYGDLFVGGDLFVADDLVFDEFTARNGNITGISDCSNKNVTESLTITGVSTFVGIAIFENNLFVAEH